MRTTVSLVRDIERLTRLRTAINIDITYNRGEADKAVHCIDELIDSLRPLLAVTKQSEVAQ